MRYGVNKRKLSRKRDIRKNLIVQMTKSLVLNKYIVTTKIRGKVLQRYIEPLIHKSINNSLTTLRYLISRSDVTTAKRLIEIGKGMNPTGGYTSLKKVGIRKGDGSTLVYLSIITNRGKQQ